MKNRFKTLPAVIFDADGRPLKAIEELSIVLGLAARAVKEERAQKQDAFHQNAQLMAMGSAVVIVILTGLLYWWANSRGIENASGWILGTMFLLLLVVLGWFVMKIREERQEEENESSAVTGLGRFYWPVGVLPLEGEGTVLWDPLSAEQFPLARLDLPAETGIEHETTIRSTEQAREAFTNLLSFDEELGRLQPQRNGWPAGRPDPSMTELGKEIGPLWQQMIDLSPDALRAAVPLPGQQEGPSWEQIELAGEQLQEFYHSIDQQRDSLGRYEERASQMVDVTREILVDRHWKQLAQVDQERERLFTPATPVEGLGNRSIPTAPNAHLLLTPADSAAQLRDSLQGLRNALQPLDASLQAELERYAQEEQSELEAAHQEFEGRRNTLEDDKRRLDSLDSEILGLGARLDEQQATIQQCAGQIQQGFTAIAEVPLGEVQSQLDELEASLRDAYGLIDDVNQKIELEVVEKTVAGLRSAAKQARNQWQELARDLPRRGNEMQTTVERILEQVTHLNNSTEADSRTTLQQLQDGAREVEKVARVVVKWAAAQEDPIDPIEQQGEELADHLAALREQRQKLERSSGILKTLTTRDAKQPLNLLDGIERVEQALQRFAELTSQTTATTEHLDQAAAVVKVHADRLGRLLEERDRQRVSYNARVSALREEEEALYGRIRSRWQERVARLQAQRAGLDQLQEVVQQRLGKERKMPDIDRMGVISDDRATYWPDLVANQMAFAVEVWGQRVTGIGAPPDVESSIGRVRNDLEQCFFDLTERVIPGHIAGSNGALRPRLCFIPFWYVETQVAPHNSHNPGKKVRIFPPLRLAPRTPTQAPEVDSLLYPEISRRLLAHLRHGIGGEALPAEAFSFPPEQLTDEGRRLDVEAASVPMHEVATALAQQWVFFRMPDQRLNRIIQNSRNNLIPESDILDAWSQSMQQYAVSDQQQTLLAQLLEEEEEDQA